jgi:hypothetical protein
MVAFGKAGVVLTPSSAQLGKIPSTPIIGHAEIDKASLRARANRPLAAAAGSSRH